jgi:hypothetical protein
MAMDDARRGRIADAIASAVSRRGLGAVATWFLEMNRPLAYLGGQALLLAQPVLGPLVGDGLLAEYAALLEDREGVDLLLQRLADREGQDGAGLAVDERPAQPGRGDG